MPNRNNARRLEVDFPSGNEQCAAWLYPAAGTGPHPILVMANGLAGIKEMRLDAFAERFQAAGYACLVFDYRHFGASGGEPRQLLDIKRQLQDWKAAIAYARTLEDANPEQVIAWGSSFGGGHVLITAAEDPRLAAAIVQCPFTNGIASSRTTRPTTSAKLAVLAIADLVGSKLGRDPIMIPSYGAPGTTALMATHDAVQGVEQLIPADMHVPKDVAARFSLQIARHFPGRRAKNIECPTFFAICENDTVAPAGPTKKYAARAPRGEVKLYDAGHFDIYLGRAFETNVTDQLAFLNSHVPSNSQLG